MPGTGTTARATVKLTGLFLEGTKRFVLVERGSMNEWANTWFMEVRMLVQTAAVTGPRCVAREMAVITVAVVVGMVIGCQNIGPTSIIILCDVIVVSGILLGGASASPPNPTGIGGVRGNH